MIFVRYFLFALATVSISACTGGGGGNGLPIDGVGKAEGEIPDFNVGIDQNSCLSPMENVFNDPDFYEEEFSRNLKSGDAPCLKKAIIRGNIDVNKEVPNVFGRDPKLPVFRAMESSALFFAKSSGRSFDVMKVLHEAGAILTVQNDKGETPLLYALKNVDQERYPSVAQYLIQTEKAAVNSIDRTGMAALHYVVKSVKIPLTLDLLEQHGAELGKTNSNGEFPLIMAIDNDWEAGAKSLVDAGVKVDVQNSQLQNALHRSVHKKMNSLSQLLISKMLPESLNAQDQSLATPIAVAIEMKNAEVTQSLLDKQVDLNTIDQNGRLPLHHAVTWNNEAIVKTIIDQTSKGLINRKNNEGLTPLFVATQSLNGNYMTWLLSRDADVNASNSVLQTSLHVATRQSFSQGMSILLAAKANVNAKDEKGQTPLHLAPHIDNVRMLMQYDADINEKNNSGQPPLVTFIKSGRQDIVLLLAQSNAALDWTGDHGKTLLHLSVSAGMSQATDFFAERLDINALDGQLQTPLFKVSDMNTLKVLLKRNPQVNVTDAQQQSPFTLFVARYLQSKSEEFLPLIDQLIKAGADVNHVLSDGETVLFRAVKAKQSLSQNYLYFGDLMNIFMASNMNFNHRDREDKTALFYVDTIQEVKDLKKGSLLGPVDISIQSSMGETAADSFMRSLYSIQSDIKSTHDDIEELNLDIAAAKDAGKTATVELLEKQLQQKMNLKSLLEEKAQHLENLITAIQS